MKNVCVLQKESKLIEVDFFTHTQLILIMDCSFKEEEKSVYLSVVLTQQKHQVQPKKTCRVCSQEMSAGQIMYYCLCRDLAALIHQKCLLIQIKKNNNFNEQKGQMFSACSSCKSKIQLKSKSKFIIKEENRSFRNIFCSQNNSDRIKNIFLLILTIVLSLAEGFLIQVLMQQDLEGNQNYYYIIRLVLNTLILLFAIVYLNYSQVLTCKRQIIGAIGVQVPMSDMQITEMEAVLEPMNN